MTNFQRNRPLPLPANVAEAVNMLTTTYTVEQFNHLDGRLTAAGFDWCAFDLPEYHAVLRHFDIIH